MGANLNKFERETIISFNAGEDAAVLYTADPVWMRKLDRLAEQNPEQFRPGRAEYYQGEAVAKRYSFPKKLLSIRSKSITLTDEQRAERAARLRNGRKINSEPKISKNSGEKPDSNVSDV